MEISVMAAGIISIVAGVVVVVWPRIIAYIIGAYLIIVGVLTIISART